MSNPESFIEEVTEEVRRDRLFAAFRKYGWIGVLLVLLTVAALLALVSAVYYWRAKTEEKHLMPDPEYAEYAAWMDRHAPVTRGFNRLRALLGSRVRTNAPAQPAE